MANSAPPTRGESPPLYRRQPLRIACVQLDTKLGMVKENAAKVEAMTSRLAPGSLDLLVLPEMCLSGYIFNTPTSILPYLEQPRIGATSLLARSLASRLKCHVIAGYPEALPSGPSDVTSEGKGGVREGESSGMDRPGTSTMGASEGEAVNTGLSTAMKALEGEGSGVGWNSAVVVGPQGDVIGNYRKTFRFETDKAWAREGDGFSYFDLPEPLGRTAVGICMDLNPKDFVAPWDAYELGTYCRDNGVDTLVVPMNWLDPPVEPPNVAPVQDPESPSEANLNYWTMRLTPLHDPTPGYSWDSPANTIEPKAGKEMVFVGCNRVGTEEGTKFIGTSCVMTMSSSPSRIELVEVCNISEERVMLATVV